MKFEIQLKQKRNISWLGGLALIWHWEGHGFEPW